MGVVLTLCHSTTNLGTRYQKRISGPLLDRIDIHAEVPRVDFDKLADDRLGEPSSKIRERLNLLVNLRKSALKVPTSSAMLIWGQARCEFIAFLTVQVVCSCGKQ